VTFEDQQAKLASSLLMEAHYVLLAAICVCFDNREVESQ